jgi:hypothetical protein
MISSTYQLKAFARKAIASVSAALVLAFASCSDVITGPVGETGISPSLALSAGNIPAASFPINNPTDFLNFTDAVIKDPTIDASLGADIDISSLNFSPIGTWNAPYTGTFEGGGFTISGFNMTSTNSFTGLFGYNLGTIENLTVQGTITIIGSSSVDYVGGIVAYNGYDPSTGKTGTIQKVDAYITINAPSGTNAYNVGGIAGFNGMDTLNSDSPDFKKDYAQGGRIERCRNFGNITASHKVGGIVGENAGYIIECRNSGLIDSDYTGKNGVGGIAGRNGNNNDAVEVGNITSCYNTGTIGVKGAISWMGGITGFQNELSMVDNCYDVGIITNPYNFGNPIIGHNEGNTTTSNYSLDTLNHTSTTPDERGITKTIVEMKDPAFVTTLNTGYAGVWKSDYSPNINNGYPIFVWE